MRSERITILVTPEQKQQLTALAKRQHVSVGELVRSAVSRTSDDASAEPVPTAEQIHALEQAADAATAALRRAGTALDRTETELAQTREAFAVEMRELDRRVAQLEGAFAVLMSEQSADSPRLSE